MQHTTSVTGLNLLLVRLRVCYDLPGGDGLGGFLGGGRGHRLGRFLGDTVAARNDVALGDTGRRLGDRHTVSIGDRELDLSHAPSAGTVVGAGSDRVGLGDALDHLKARVLVHQPVLGALGEQLLRLGLDLGLSLVALDRLDSVVEEIVMELRAHAADRDGCVVREVVGDEVDCVLHLVEELVVVDGCFFHHVEHLRRNLA